MANDRGRLIAIGDVHGCVHALDALLEVIKPSNADRLVFLGDLIDQGHDSCQVLERLIELQSQCQLILIRGNHEEMLDAARTSEAALRYWEECGGVMTLNSYHFVQPSMRFRTSTGACSSDAEITTRRTSSFSRTPITCRACR